MSKTAHHAGKAPQPTAPDPFREIAPGWSRFAMCVVTALANIVVLGAFSVLVLTAL